MIQGQDEKDILYRLKQLESGFIGTIKIWGSNTIPDGWLLCNGQAINRTTYATLFGIIGTTFGVGDGSTTFNVPDLVGGVPRGAGTSTGYTQNVTITLGAKDNDAGQGHVHYRDSSSTTYGMLWNNPSGAYSAAGGTAWQVIQGTKTSSPITDGTNGTPRTANETKMKNVGVNFIIKT